MTISLQNCYKVILLIISGFSHPYRLCKDFWFLKSSIIFFTNAKVTTSPSVLAPVYCGSTTRVHKENNAINTEVIKLRSTYFVFFYHQLFVLSRGQQGKQFYILLNM